MKIEFETMSNHGQANPDGSIRQDHCCGCWNVKISDQNPLHPYLVCNECGETRTYLLPVGVDG